MINFNNEYLPLVHDRTFLEQLADANFSDSWIEVGNDNLPVIAPRSFWKTKQANFELVSTCVIAFFQNLQKEVGAADLNVLLRAISNLSAHWKQCKKEKVQEKVKIIDEIFEACLMQPDLKLEKKLKSVELREKSVEQTTVELHKEVKLSEEEATKNRIKILNDVKLSVSNSGTNELLKSLFKERQAADLQIICSDDKIVCVHSSIAFSEFRQDDDEEQIKELCGCKDFDNKKGWFALKDFSSKTVETLIEILYLGATTQELSLEEIIDLSRLADFTGLKHIVDECLQQIQSLFVLHPLYIFRSVKHLIAPQQKVHLEEQSKESLIFRSPWMNFIFTNLYNMKERINSEFSNEEQQKFYLSIEDINTEASKTFIAFCITCGIAISKDALQNQNSLYQELTELNNQVAQFCLATHYHKLKNWKKAFECLENAAEWLGCAANLLGFYYCNGIGVIKNHMKALNWYERAAWQGDASAQDKLALIYSSDKLISHSELNREIQELFDPPKDFVSFEKLVENAARKAYAAAQERGYEIGKIEVNEDLTRAFEWCEKAARQGLARAQYRLGLFYSHHHYKLRGACPHDEKKTFEWFEKSAKLGYSDAQMDLGRLYRDGIGVQQDRDKCIEWLQKADKQGASLAALKLRELGVEPLQSLRK